jgi:hypothetical protein
MEEFCVRGCGLRTRAYRPLGVDEDGGLVEAGICGHWYCRIVAATRVLVFGFPEIEVWIDDDELYVFETEDDEDEDWN